MLFGTDTLTLADKLSIIASIAAGVQHLHESNIVHRDLVARNVLLAKSKQGKISEYVSIRLQVSVSPRASDPERIAVVFALFL